MCHVESAIVFDIMSEVETRQECFKLGVDRTFLPSSAKTVSESHR